MHAEGWSVPLEQQFFMTYSFWLLSLVSLVSLVY
uniref:Uncharacterized protein n=1 Tax=Setaria italica TaxID=4555 RepID=K3ZPJ7_SETIT